MSNFSIPGWLIAVISAVMCGALGIGFWLDPAGFQSNLLAEVTGMCLTILLTVMMLERIARRIADAERSVQQRHLHDSLSRILGLLLESTGGNPFHWSKHARYAEPLAAKLETLRQIQAALDAGTYKLTTLQEKCVVETSHESIEAMRTLSPVAFQLSGSRGLIWLSLCNSATQLAKLFPFKPADSAVHVRTIKLGADSFCLAFCELLEHMLAFEQDKTLSTTSFVPAPTSAATRF